MTHVVAGLREQKRFLEEEGFLAADFDFASWIREPLELAKQSLAEQSASPVTRQAAS